MRRNTRRAAVAAKRAIPDFTPLTADDLALAERFAGAQPFTVAPRTGEWQAGNGPVPLEQQEGRRHG